MITSIVVIVSLMFSPGATISVTTTEITSPTDRFNTFVWSITLHPDNPRLLIVTDRFAVHTFNPETKTKKLIAGSTSSGYVEGRGADARFDDIFGVSHFNETTIIVTDRDNHCVRLVSLVSQLTERYAGVCQSRGYSDGERLSAKFNSPQGITRVGTSFYVCDYNNDKIRQLRGNSVSTVVSRIDSPTAITSTQNKLFYSFRYGIGEFDLNSQTNKILTGGASDGFGDGSLSSAGFGSMYGITSLTEKILLAADGYNKAVRLVDLNKQTVSSITMPTYPYSLLPYNGNILVGLHDGRIVKFSLTQLPVTQTADIKCDTNKTLSIPTTDYTVRFEPRIIRSGEVECVRCPSPQDISVGVHTFLYTYMNKLGQYVQKVCEQQITVIAAGVMMLNCPDNMKLILPNDSLTLNTTLPRPDITRTRLQCLNCPPHTQLLSEGVHEVDFIFQDKLTKQNVNCSYQVDVKPTLICKNDTKHLYLRSNQTMTDRINLGQWKLRVDTGATEVEVTDGCSHFTVHAPVDLKCPEDFSVYLPAHTRMINITLPTPEVDDTRLSCVECPDSVKLDSGDHNVTFTHMDKLYNVTIGCSYLITVIEQPAPVCHNITKRLFLRPNQKKTDEIKIGGSEFGIRFDEGEYEVKIRDGCYITYVVNEWSPMERRAYLEAEYRFNCKSLSQLSYSIIETGTKQHTTYLKQLCTGCGVNVSSPDLSCFNDKLIITWKTSVTADQQVQTSDMINKLEKDVKQFEVKYPAIDLTVSHTTPRIASPVRQKSGLYLKVDIRTSCQKEGYIYNKNSDGCDKVSVGVAEVHCPTDMKLILPYNVNQLNISLPQPQIDDTRLSCVECPDSVQLDAGDHNITFTYMDNIYNATIECRYRITVIEQTAPTSTCHKCSNKSADSTIYILSSFVGLLVVVVIVGVIYIVRLKRNQNNNHSSQTKSAAELGQPTVVTHEQPVRVYESLKMDNYENVEMYEQIQTQQNPCYVEILPAE